MAGDATSSVMRAGDVGRAARRDLQFRIPRKPVVRLGLRARPEETGWIIDGARKSQVLGGAFAREHMGALLQACDGTRTLDEIGEVTGVGPQAAFEAVSLLWTGGIVEEGDTEPAPGDPPPELARLLSRLGDSTGVNDSWQDAARRLAAARVAVVGDAELAGEMVAALEPTLPEVRLDSAPRRGDTLTVLVDVLGELLDDGRQGAHPVELAHDEGGGRAEPVVLARVGVEQHRLVVHPDDEAHPAAQARDRARRAATRACRRCPRRTHHRAHRGLLAPSGRFTGLRGTTSGGGGTPGPETRVSYPPPWGRQQDVVDALAAQAGHEAEAALAGHEAEAALAGQDALALLKAQPRALPSGSSSTPKSLSARVRSIELFVICCSPPSLRCLVGRSGTPSGPGGPVCRDRAPTPRTGWSVELCDAVCSSGSVWPAVDQRVGRRRSRRAGRD